MGDKRPWLGWALGITVVAACSPIELQGEFDRAACDNGRDDDDDDLADCEDPDCQLHDFCRRHATTRAAVERDGGGAGTQAEATHAASDAGPERDNTAGSGGAAPEVAPGREGEGGADGVAGIGEAPAGAGGGGGIDDAVAGASVATEDLSGPAAGEAQVDAPTDSPEQCGPNAMQCAPSSPVDTCDGGDCAGGDVPTAGGYRITEITVAVPRQTSYTLDNNVDCVDANSQCLFPAPEWPFLLCACTPDPWVEVVVDGEVIGQTDVRVNSDTGSWEVDFPFVIEGATEIRFNAMDRDILDDTLIYTCGVEADEELLSAGTLACEQSFTTDGGRMPFGVTARVFPTEG